jgi:hypothetical protein
MSTLADVAAGTDLDSSIEAAPKSSADAMTFGHAIICFLLSAAHRADLTLKLWLSLATTTSLGNIPAGQEPRGARSPAELRLGAFASNMLPKRHVRQNTGPPPPPLQFGQPAG